MGQKNHPAEPYPSLCPIKLWVIREWLLFFKLQTNCEVASLILIFQMRKLRYREVTLCYTMH